MPVTITDKKACFGCTACFAICPTKAIQMKPDEEGFFYPQVDMDKCIHCDKCIRACPMKNQCENNYPLTIYAAKNRDLQIRMVSSSGGVFSALARYIEQEDGVIYGAAFDEEHNVVHTRATGNQWVRFCESKYVQSDLNISFQNVRADLESGKLVLFSGTPCQIDGLKAFLTQSRVALDNLLMVDIVCHGTPSPTIWREWLNWKMDGQAVGQIHFRDKKEVGWHKSTLTLESEGGSVISKEPQNKGVFWKLFFNHFILKPACGVCPFANFQRIGDFTLGDYWGVEHHHPEMDDDRGTSLVMINSVKAEKVWEKIKDQFEFIEIEKEACLQPNLQSPSQHNPQRDVFWMQFRKHGFQYASKYIGLLETKGAEKYLLLGKRKMHSLIQRIGKRMHMV